MDVRSQDPSRALPAIPNRPYPPADTLYEYRDPDDPSAYLYRRMFILEMNVGATRSEFDAVMSKFDGEVVGGVPNFRWYIVRTSDPGVTIHDIDARSAAIQAMPGVAFAGVWLQDIIHTELTGRPPSQAAQPSRHALPADWPPIPPVAGPRDDSQYVVLYGDPPGGKVYRRLYAVSFREGTKADSVRAVLLRLHAVPVGGTDAVPLYIVKVPDPGPTAAGVDHILAEFKRSTVVEAVRPWPVTPERNDPWGG